MSNTVGVIALRLPTLTVTHIGTFVNINDDLIPKLLTLHGGPEGNRGEHRGGV